MFKRQHPDSDISLQEGTADVPRDGFFYVLKGGEIVARHKTLKKATAAYNAYLEESGVNREAEKPTLAPEEVMTRVVGDFYVYGKSKVKKSTGTRTYG